MNAYTLVDGNVRKKLDETLKTWREPVPGSLSSTPVFRLDITQRIVDALSKARLAAQQNRNQQTPLLGSRIAISQAQPYRNTPTPPQNLPNYGRSSYTAHTQPPSRNGFPAPYAAPHVCPPPRLRICISSWLITTTDFSVTADTASSSAPTCRNVSHSAVRCASPECCRPPNSLSRY
jgi:pre-mRNA cleavage complex 2 protein Pcf11